MRKYTTLKGFTVRENGIFEILWVDDTPFYHWFLPVWARTAFPAKELSLSHLLGFACTCMTDIPVLTSLMAFQSTLIGLPVFLGLWEIKERVLLEYRRARENKIKAASFGEEGWWWLLLSACPYILLHSGLTVSRQEGRVGLLSLFSNLEKEVERYCRLFHLLLWLFVELTWSFFWTRMSSSDLPHRL